MVFTFKMLVIAMLLGSVAGEDRVARARRRKEPTLRALCKRAAITYPPKSVFFRAFKEEMELEVWAGAERGEKMAHLKTYTIARASGGPGPKRREGDGQVPEGCYMIDNYNPGSSYHLSLRVNYPNASDRILSDHENPGGDIYIHGSNLSIGCLAMTDDPIEEIYLLALAGRSNGVPIHIFPARMSKGKLASILTGADSATGRLWRDLAVIYNQFEKTHVIPVVSVSRDGRYKVSGQ